MFVVCEGESESEEEPGLKRSGGAAAAEKGLFKKSEKYRRETHNPLSSRLLFSLGTQFVTPLFLPICPLPLPLPPPFF